MSCFLALMFPLFYYAISYHSYSLSIDINMNSRSLKNGYCFFSSLLFTIISPCDCLLFTSRNQFTIVLSCMCACGCVELTGKQKSYGFVKGLFSYWRNWIDSVEVLQRRTCLIHKLTPRRAPTEYVHIKKNLCFLLKNMEKGDFTHYDQKFGNTFYAGICK